MQKLLVDYSTPVFKFPYEREGAKYYATFHPELLEVESGILEYTGRFFVVTVTNRGLFHFHIERDMRGNWNSENASFLVDPDLIQWCGERIEARNLHRIASQISA
ncbi:MAG: hypothetical protein C5B52_08450 [Bacteroidetes bacterium]|nr:MAG: hypothetical protein C5B52_08450 [Bacteroidota bacterium]